MKAKSRTFRTVIWLAGIAAGATGWSTLLWPPVRFYYAKPETGFWATVGQLLAPTNSIFPDGPFVGWFFLLSSVLLLFTVPYAVLRILGFLIRYIEISEADISLLELKITLRFSDGLSKTTVIRDQLFHANQPGTTAYHYKQTAQMPNARILPDTFEMETAVNNEKLTKAFSITSTEKSFDAIEIFDRSLPTSFLATYLPDWIVSPVYAHTPLLDHAIIRRNGQIVMINEHDGSEGIYELNSSRRSKKVQVTLDFPADKAPRPDDVRCFIIRGNVVSEMRLKSCTSHDRRMFIVDLSQLEKSSQLRLQWLNRASHSESPHQSAPRAGHIERSYFDKFKRLFIRDKAPKISIIDPV